MIFYFSATGNDKYAAEKIAAATGDTLVSIGTAIRSGALFFQIRDGENLGLVIPTYFGGFPLIVKAFFEQAEIVIEGANHYGFAVVTYGMETGNIGGEAKALLNRLKLSRQGIFSVKMVDNWIPCFDMNDKAYIAEAEQTGEAELSAVLPKIAMRTEGCFVKRGTPKILQKLSDAYYHSACATKRFRLSDQCVGCGLCERQCPSAAIQLRDGKPVWVKKRCTLCLGCVHRCPKNAIGYTKKTADHGRYWNPNTEPEVS